MTNQKFHAQLRQQSGVAVIDLSGDIDIQSEVELNSVYAQAKGKSPGVVVLNFKEINHINSTGIALIVGLLAQARKARCRIVVYGLNDHYTEIFQITRLSDFMNIFPDEVAALQDVA